MSIKTTVITGPTSGIGKVTAQELAKKDHALYLLVRNMEKGGTAKGVGCTNR
jgi:short-subunit dehydrogenase